MSKSAFATGWWTSLIVCAGLLAGAMGVAADDGTRIVVTDVDVSQFPEVHIVASVLDAAGRPVRGLTAADLTLTEGSVPQRATIELASQSSALAVALVLDTSGSMGGRPLADAKLAMNALVQSLGPRDQAAILTFDVDVRVAQALTSDKAALVAATNRASAGGDTAIYDALSTAVGVLNAAPADARRTIILLTDGIDNSSKAQPASVVASLANARVATNVIGLGSDLNRPALRAIVAGGSAGSQFLEAPSSAQLAAAYAGLSEQILTQYSVTYRSSAVVADGTTIPIGLTVRRGGADFAMGSAAFTVPAGRGVKAPTPAPVLPLPATDPAPAVQQPSVAPVRVSSELVGLLGAATVLTLLLWISELASRYPGRQKQRLEVFVRGLTLTSPEYAKRRSIVQRVVVPTLRSAGRPLMRVTPAGMISSTRDRLQAAGEPMGLGPVEFLGVRAGLGLIFAIMGLAIVISLTGDTGGASLGILAGLLLGFAIPGLVLDAIGRRRKAAIRRALSASLDMLALSAEAGLSFDGAIGQVAHRWHNPLSDELRRLLVEFQMGRERRDALRELAQRTGVAELSRFANAVIQADSLGVPLSRVLHEQSTEIRVRRRQRAEEQAQKAPVKMLFPMVFLIFPALFVVVLGPAVPRLLQAFSAFN